MVSMNALATSRSNPLGRSTASPGIRMFSKAIYLGLYQPSVTAAPLKDYLRIALEDLPRDPDDPSLWIYLAIAGILVLLGGAFAGLTIALMGQDGVYLQVIATSGEGKEQRHAQSVYRLLQRGKHWVLVTLLLSNVIVNETLPIVLDRSLGGGWPAVLGSTVLIVIFGEVIPQSICVRYGLSIGAYMTPFVLALMWLLAPIAWPTAKLLDKLLGEDHGTVYKKSGLKTLITLHKTLGPNPSDKLNQDEVTIISAVLDLKDKAVGDIMTPMDDVFTMSADTVLDEKTMDIILTAGYSRIPIYESGNEQNFVGMLLVKILITYDPEDEKRVSDFALATLPETRPETSCLDIVNFFQEGKSHMVLVSEHPGENNGAIGVVTLEDVIEELIGEEIIDESDVYIDVHKAIRRMTPAPKARIQKKNPSASPRIEVTNIPEHQLIDLSEEQDAISKPKPKPTDNLVNRNGRADSNASVSTTSPKTTFKRRSSAGADGLTGTVSIRGNANEMREHLKHLGPSNLASRPKTTRWNSVKIKPGQIASVQRDLRPGSQLRTQSVMEVPYQDNAGLQGGEGEGLLKSAGKDAKDGVQALQQGYGSFERNASRKPIPEYSALDGSSMDAPRDIEVGRTQSSSRLSRSLHKSQVSSDESTDTLGSLQSRGESSRSRKKRPARSGSITENVVEAGGVRKVVLETNSAESDEGALSDSATRLLSNDADEHLNRELHGDNYNGEGPKDGEKKKKQKKRRKNRSRKGDNGAERGGSAAH